MLLYLVRHPKPVVAEGICYGGTDLLPESGHLQEVAGFLHDTLPLQRLRIITSPLQRCRLLADELGHDYTVAPAIAEMSFGAWEGLHWDNLPRDQLEEWQEDFHNYVPPQGESVNQFLARVREYLLEQILTQPRDTLLLTHAGVIRCLLDYCGETPIIKGERVKLDYGGITQMSYNHNSLQLERLNLTP